MKKQYLKKIFTRQHDSSDCGPACLQTVLRYYRGFETMEAIRELSGHAKDGTTLLGLRNAARRLGFEAEGLEANVEFLRTQRSPVILHITRSNQNHFLIFFCFKKNKVILGDPAVGIIEYEISVLAKQWVSGLCLQLTPNQFFKTQRKRSTWRLLYHLVRPDVNLMLVSFIVGSGVAAMGIVLAVLSMELIDKILPDTNAPELIPSIAIASSLLCFRVILSHARNILLLKQKKEFNTRLTSIFFDRLITKPKSFFDRRKTGELVSRLSDTTRIQQVVSFVTGSLLIDAMLTVFCLFFIFLYSWQSGLVAAVCIITFALYVIFVSKDNLSRCQTDVMISSGEVQSNYINVVNNIGAIQNLGKEAAFGDLYKQVFKAYQNKVIALGTINNNLTSLSGFLIVAGLMAIISFAAIEVYASRLSIGELIAIMTLSSNLLLLGTSLPLAIVPLSEAKIALERVDELVSFDGIAGHDKKHSIRELVVLEISNLRFGFPGRPLLLSGVEFQLEKGQILHLIGANGSGKSTLCNLILNQYQPTAGAILANGMDLSLVERADWQKIVSIVSQNIEIINGDIFENVALQVPCVEKQDILKFTVEFGFDRFIGQFPNGYNTILGEYGIHLSGGQKKVIALARALYRKPQLLILDEVTTSMDKYSEQFTIETLKKVKSKMAIILVSHSTIPLLDGIVTSHYLLTRR